MHVECRARDLHDFFNVTLRTVDVSKARKMVMKSKIVLNMTYKTHIKNVCIFDHEKKVGLKKLLNIRLIYIIKYMLHRIIVHFVLQALLLLYFPKFEDTHVCLNRADPD